MRNSPKLEEELFAAALALPATERDGYLQRACDGDPYLRARVKTLLDAFEDGASFVRERPRVTQFESTGDQIVNYRLLEEIGEGGCGVVYLAEQVTPVKREVALKIIKLGMDTKAVIARFEAERQAIALMDHPNIAKVFDAGATATGRPYFVMELVRGIKITEYCDQTRLSIPDRLSLFIQLCQAIQHAHHKGIIHRDIKPSNVLVTLHDGVPLVKVIDFGIAKATQGRLTDQTLHTALEQFIGTPAYVSPEQTQLGSVEADTRSDIYSLGVLLYELLTGCTPFDTAELLQAGLDEMRKRIREEDPPTPSKRLGALTHELITSTSTCYQTTAASLIKQLHGDLDWIVMRCLQKERTRRYQTASDLASDLKRYLHSQPVVARPPSVVYAFGKFAQRHRVVFATGATIIAVLIVATAVSTWQAVRATQAETLSQEVIASLLEVFSAADPFTTQGTEFTPGELLERASRAIRNNDLSRYPEVRARLLESIGRIYRRQNQYEQSLNFLEEALRIRKQLPDADGTKTASVLSELADTQRQTGDLVAAEKTLKQALNLIQIHRAERSLTYVNVLTSLGRTEIQMSNLVLARNHLEESLSLSKELRGPRDTETAGILLTLSGVFLWSDELQAAERAARESIAIYVDMVPSLSPDRVMAEVRLAEVLLVQNRVNEAAPLLEKSLESQRVLYGSNSRQVADAFDGLALIRRSQGQLAEAEDFSRRAVTIAGIALGERHYMTACYRTSLAVHLIRRGKFAEAETQLRQSLQVYANALSPDHHYVASSEYWLGEVLLATDRLSDAEEMLTISMNRWKRSDAPVWRSARSASALGEVLYRQDRAREAEHYLVDSYRALASDPKADRDARVAARERITRFYTDRGERKKLEGLMLATNRDPAVSAANLTE